jgi:hypothetical protein
MKTFGKIPRLIRCLPLLAAALGVPIPTQAADAGPPSGINVNVINTPLSVNGTVSVSNLPATQTVTGAVTATIAGTPGVQVLNSVLDPVPVTSLSDPSAQPFQALLTYSSSTGTTGTVSVPANKRLVLQYVAASLSFAPAGTKVAMSFVIEPPGNRFIINLPTVLQGNFVGSDVYVVSQLIHVTAEAGWVLACSSIESAPTTSFDGTCLLSGYLVNVP